MSATLGAATPAAEGPGRHPEGPLLHLDQVSVGFGGLLALDDVSMSVNPGEIVGVIGPNGAGKTTLFNVICGFVHPDSGLDHLPGHVAAQPPSSRPGPARHRPDAAGRRALCRADRARERDARAPSRAAQRHRVRVPGSSGARAGKSAAWRLRAREILDELGAAAYARPVPAVLALRHSEAHRTGPRAHGGTAASSARRAGQRALEDRDGRAGPTPARSDRRGCRCSSSSTTWTW